VAIRQTQAQKLPKKNPRVQSEFDDFSGFQFKAEISAQKPVYVGDKIYHRKSTIHGFPEPSYTDLSA